MVKKILLVGGTWNEKGGMPSSIIKKMHKIMNVARVHNGGNYEDLRKIIESTPKYDYVFWFANVENNDLAKIRNVKDYNPKCMLITSKRNDNNKYDYEELLQRALSQKANLCFEFSKVADKLFNIRVFDPLGCVWYDGTDITLAVQACLNRLEYLANVTRKPSISSTGNIEVEFNETDKKFLEIIKSSANTFHNLMCLPDHVDRFVGNASLRFKTPTRCMDGFPAIRKDNLVLMSRRNVDKTGISEKDFVPCFLNDDENVEYFGENKPSVDSPVQLRVFREYPNIDYILHGHVYIKDAPFTSMPIPCGAVEEINEIIANVPKDTDFAVLNLKGHGCLIMTSAKNLDRMNDVIFEVRKLPEFI